MNKRIVAELGRPETAQETADRKAEASRIYRSSQTTRNLVAALIATVAIVVLVVMISPRGERPEPAPVDVASVAETQGARYDRDFITPDVPEGWRANGASVEVRYGVPAWTVIYRTPEDGGSFIRLAQGVDADEAWANRYLDSSIQGDTINIDGIEWQEYSFGRGDDSRNISYAIGTQVGDDYVVLYGSASAEETQGFAETFTDQLTTEESE